MVERETSGKTNFYKGTGVVIASDMILTAGHNFFYLPDTSLSSVILSTHPNWGDNSKGQKRIAVKKVILFPGFTQSSFGTMNDLALVLLSKPLPARYRPLKMQLEGANPPALGELTTIVGFGRNTETADATLKNYRLRKVDLPFARWDLTNIFNSQKLWVSQQRGAIAGGDSGGPLLLRRNGEYYIYGVAIHHRYDECVKNGTCEDQGAFSNLSFFKDWIENSLLELKSQ